MGKKSSEQVCGAGELKANISATTEVMLTHTSLDLLNECERDRKIRCAKWKRDMKGLKAFQITVVECRRR